MNIIQKISSKQTYIVRHPMLRQGKSIDSCHFDGDDLPTTTHYGLTVDKNIVGVVSVFQNKNGIFVDENQHQIRGMAVLESFQNKGYGQYLVKHCEKDVLSKNGKLIWFNARENAVPFYKKHGYLIYGIPFIIEDIGLHYIMYKMLV